MKVARILWLVFLLIPTCSARGQEYPVVQDHELGGPHYPLVGRPTTERPRAPSRTSATKSLRTPRTEYAAKSDISKLQSSIEHVDKHVSDIEHKVDTLKGRVDSLDKKIEAKAKETKHGSTNGEVESPSNYVSIPSVKTIPPNQRLWQKIFYGLVIFVGALLLIAIVARLRNRRRRNRAQ